MFYRAHIRQCDKIYITKGSLVIIILKKINVLQKYALALLICS